MKPEKNKPGAILLLAAAAISAAALSCGCSGTGSPSGTIMGVDRNSGDEISYVRTRHIEDWQTRTIGEALTGEEFTHGRLTLRSQPDSREGMYFFVMMDWGPDDIALGCTIDLYVDSSATAKVRKYEFAVPETSSVLREIVLGLTGSDWKGRSEKVNAWKIVIKTPSGRTIAQKQSWLWSIEDGKLD